jgi:NADPH2:quinone reductase
VKAIRVHAPGGPEALRLDEIPTPTPGARDALVRLDAIGVNFIDVYFRTGQYPAKLPMTLGQEGAGVVEAVGSEVRDIRPGDRVAYASVNGAYAEYALVPADRLVQVPTGVSPQDAAAVMLQGMTAHYLATSTYPLKRGDVCLIQAVAGGVGLLLTQIAKMRGARVIGTTSTEEKAALARAAGADDVILYTKEDFVAAVKERTGGRGVQVVYDSVGKTTFLPGLDVLAPRGLMALFGQSSGPVQPLDPQLLNRKGSLFLTRPTLGTYTAARDELLSRAGEVLAWVASGSLHVRIDRALPLANAADAHRALESRETSGKVILEPRT